MACPTIGLDDPPHMLFMQGGFTRDALVAKSFVITVDHVQCYVSFVSMLCCVDVPQFQVPTATVHTDFAVTSDDCPRLHIMASNTSVEAAHPPINNTCVGPSCL